MTRKQNQARHLLRSSSSDRTSERKNKQCIDRRSMGAMGMRRSALAVLLFCSADDVAAFSSPAAAMRRPLPLAPSPSDHVRIRSNMEIYRINRCREWCGGNIPLFSDRNDSSDEEASAYNEGVDANAWISSDDGGIYGEPEEDWEEALRKRQDGTAWTSFEPTTDEGDDSNSAVTPSVEELNDASVWLDTLSSSIAEEIEFINKEADRADKVRQMQEFGFDAEQISSTLGVATDYSLETDEDNEALETFQEEAQSWYGEDVDLTKVESHTEVEMDEETGEPIRTQMVYVDEHSCIGCTNCAMIAQSTFFMESDMGRARVYQQWGDDEETIQVAIETCPVDCIHYVPYDELKRLEIERRDQNINFKARLVNQGEYGGGTSHRVGGPAVFTGPQKISGNMGARCNNCPSAGCKNCPMYGVGKNPEFERKEKMRKERIAKKRLEEELKRKNKSADL